MYQNISLCSVMEAGDHFKNGASQKSQMSKGNRTRIVCVLLMTFCVNIINMYAQDVIILKNAEEIPAVVQEVGDVEIKYKKIENPTGPNYTLKKSAVLMIKYANGSKDVFVDNTEPTVAAKPSAVRESNKPNMQGQANSQLRAQGENTTLSVIGGKVYLDGKRIKHRQINTLLSAHDMKTNAGATDMYLSGYSRSKNATVFSVIGAIFACTGFGLMIAGGQQTNSDYPISDLKAARYVLSGVGLVCLIPALTLKGAGDRRIKKAAEIYNASIQPKYSSDASLSFGITQSGGVGFVLNF